MQRLRMRRPQRPLRLAKKCISATSLESCHRAEKTSQKADIPPAVEDKRGGNQHLFAGDAPFCEPGVGSYNDRQKYNN